MTIDSTVKMETLVQEVKQLAAITDEDSRYRLANTLRELSFSLETPRDALFRIAGLVR